VKLSLTSRQGKEAVVALLDGGNIFGDTALAFHQSLCPTDVIALTDVHGIRIEPDVMTLDDPERLVRPFARSSAIGFAILDDRLLPSARSSESAPKKQAEPIYRDVLDRGEMVFFEVKDVVLPTKHHSLKRLISSWLQTGRLWRPAAAASEDVFAVRLRLRS